MAGYRVLRDAGESLVRVLFQELHDDPQTDGLIDDVEKISQRSPKEIIADNSSALLSVYLYRVVENPFVKNQFPISGTGDRLRKPPLTLDLNYMITPLLKDPGDRQIVLGKVMQVLYDRAILEGADLVPPFDQADEPIRIILNPVPLEEITKIWQAMELDYKLSVCYVVRVTLIDSEIEQDAVRIVENSTVYGGF